MYQMRRVTMDAIAEDQYGQIVSIAAPTDPDLFTPEMLQDCIDDLYTVVFLDGDMLVGYAVVNPNSKSTLEASCMLSRSMCGGKSEDRESGKSC